MFLHCQRLVPLSRFYPEILVVPLEASWEVHVEARGVPWLSMMDEDNETASSKIGIVSCFIHSEVYDIGCNPAHLGAPHLMHHLAIISA